MPLAEPSRSVSTPVNNGMAIVANASALNVLTDWTNGGVLSNAATGAVSGGNLTNAGTINGSDSYNGADRESEPHELWRHDQ